MSLLEQARAHEGVRKLLGTLCDIVLLDECCKPQNEGGHLTYNIVGQTFARAGDGSEYILLADGSVGYWGSSGQLGRMADSVEDFFEFVINCPLWTYYAWMYHAGKPPMWYYQDNAALNDFAFALMQRAEVDIRDVIGIDFDLGKKALSSALGVTLYENIVDPVLMKFYKSATRAPRLITTYTEADGSSHSASGVLIQDT